MREFRQFVEIFNSQLNAEKPYVDNRMYVSVFHVGEAVYKFSANKVDDITDNPAPAGGHWKILFRNLEDGAAENGYGITGSGSATAVFASVMKILGDFIRQKQPDSGEFSASELSRQNLYIKMIQRFVSQFGYKMEMSDTNLGQKDPKGKTFGFVRMKQPSSRGMV
jgi:hypothetical protein